MLAAVTARADADAPADAAASTPPAATAASPANTEDCTKIRSETRRLVCYDSQARRPPSARGLILDEMWPSVADEDRSRLTLMGHNTNYLMLRHSNRPNETPVSPTQGRSDAGDLASTETKYQISVKTPLRRRLFNGRLQLWLAYTQQSHWQVFRDSGPFRETNYEPEAMALIRIDQKLPGGIGLRYVNIGAVHQSNGQGGNVSRSWNRIYAQFAFEHGDRLALLVRPWFRLPELESIDGNPDITRYLGRADATLLWRGDWFATALTLRSNLSFSGHRGAAQLSLFFPLYRQLQGYVQVFTGYGESLIDQGLFTLRMPVRCLRERFEQGANRSRVGHPARIRNTARGVHAGNPEGTNVSARMAALSSWPGRPVRAASSALPCTPRGSFALASVVLRKV